MNDLVIVSTCLGLGGVERSSANLANILSKQQTNVTFISILKRDKFYSLSDNIRYIEPDGFNINNLSIIKTFFWLRKVISDIENNIPIIVYGKQNGSLLMLSSIFLNKKIILSERTSPLAKWPLQQRIFDKLIYTILKPKAIISQTKIASVYQSKYYGKNIPIKVIPNILKPITHFQLSKEKIILFVGRIYDPLKGFDRFLKILSITKLMDWRIHVAGDVLLPNSKIESLIKTYNLMDRIIFLGKVTNIDYHYSYASVFAMTSRSEGFPNALLEAMGHGLACISYDFIAGPSDIIMNNVSGLIVKDGNFQKFSKGLYSLINNERLRLELGNHAKLAVQKYSEDNIINSYKSFISAI